MLLLCYLSWSECQPFFYRSRYHSSVLGGNIIYKHQNIYPWKYFSPKKYMIPQPCAGRQYCLQNFYPLKYSRLKNTWFHSSALGGNIVYKQQNIYPWNISPLKIPDITAVRWLAILFTTSKPSPFLQIWVVTANFSNSFSSWLKRKHCSFKTC